MTHERRQSALRTFAATAAYDLRHATRSAFKDPAVAVLAILTLALGIGATTAILSVVEAAYFSRYPLRDPNRLFRVYGEDRASGSAQLNFSYPRFLFFRDHQTSFESFAAVNATAVTIGGPDEVQLVAGSAMTSDFLTTFGAEPVI